MNAWEIGPYDTTTRSILLSHDHYMSDLTGLPITATNSARTRTYHGLVGIDIEIKCPRPIRQNVLTNASFLMDMVKAEEEEEERARLDHSLQAKALGPHPDSIHSSQLAGYRFWNLRILSKLDLNSMIWKQHVME